MNAHFGKSCALALMVVAAGCGSDASTSSNGSSAGAGGALGSGSAGRSSSAGASSSSGGSLASGGALASAGSPASAAGAAGSQSGSQSGAGGAFAAGSGGGGGSANGPPQTVSGQLYGLTPGESITLQNNAGDDITLSANGKFSFSKSVTGGATYNVTILSSPTSPIAQDCLVWDGSGTVGSSTVSDVRVNCDLLAYYPFNGNAQDESGYAHDGTVSGATLTADRAGGSAKAYSFANKATIVATMPVGFLPINDQPRTLTAWLKPSQTNSLYGVIFWGAGNCTGLQFGLADQGDKAGFWGGCDDFTSSLALPLGSWTFVALVYSPDTPTTLTLYVNDASSKTTITALTTGVSAGLTLGGDSGADAFFNGEIDSVRVYGHALQAAEVAAVRAAADP